ncbi:polyamine aminopropyltransferase [Fulvivirga sp. 29W222]|uniref:Polyamine aminopropyltransferase n=1 Tax=Fulvivirga marina TaxID=2494733 RepID=A0A937KBM7_9BACT|nr:polyamine aminopropyltransferase [Fulvivirga marina]MBL6447121.1 polyamine aminopropyltransferase [Fulvivirga marina]
MKLRSNLLKLALFATGLSGIVAEYVLSTLATYFLGDSVFQWTMIVSIMLFSMGLGSRLSKWFVNSNLLQNFIYIEFTLSILAAFVSVITYITSAFYGYVGFAIYAMSVVIGLLIGMEIPLVIRLNDEFEDLRVNVSSVMEKDYYGSLLGGVFFAFIGLPYLGLTYTPFILGSINFMVACGLFLMLRSSLGSRLKLKLSGMSFLVFAMLVVGFVFAKPIIDYGEESRYQDKIVYQEQSKYQKIVITKTREDFWLFINGNQQLSSVDEVMYHEPLVHPVMKLSKTPQQVLVMGGGDGGAVREILKYDQVEQVTLVDLDPAMTRLGQEHELLLRMNKNALNHRKVDIINTDGFKYLEDCRQYFDVIIVDLPDPKTVELGRLYSYEFYRLCFSKLRPNGLIITQAGSPYYAARAFNCIEATMQAAGFATVPLHNQVLTLGEWGWVLGSKVGSTEEIKNALQRLKYSDIETQWINHDAMTLITSFGKEIFPDGQRTVEVNKVHNPVLYKYYLKGKWDLY